MSQALAFVGDLSTSLSLPFLRNQTDIISRTRSLYECVDTISTRIDTNPVSEVPPRLMFLAQTISTFVACFVVVGVQAWMFGSIPGLCEQHHPGWCRQIR